MITLDSVTLQRGSKLLLEQASVAIFAKQKIGLVGVNGCGKSSLLSLILQKISPDGGNLYVQSGIRIAYLAQEESTSGLSALQYVQNGDPDFFKLNQQLNQAQVEHDDYKLIELHNRLYEIGGYSLESKAAKLLIGLGFNQNELQKTVNTFSGGWRMRLNLAQVLMSNADLLLLDEPTNYLDIDAIIWLESWLQNYAGTLLLISHDRDFLDQVIQKTLYLNERKLELYSGNYSSFERQRAEQLAQKQALYNKQQAKVDHLTKYINRFRAKASKARQAQSRIKMLEKMELVSVSQIDSPFTFKFMPTPPCSAPLVHITDANVSYGEHRVLSKINFSLNPQDAIGILGINGAGKSTFIKLLAGVLPPNAGTITFNKNLKIGYFAQYQVEQLDMQASPLEHLRKLDIQAKEQQLRAFLGSFNFRDEMVFQPIANFSGGEKARLVLALIIWQKPNLLLLDEPTNHLDLEMRQALNYALQDYTGALILVAHDRYLLKATVNEFYLVNNKTIAKFSGDLEDYQNWSIDIKKQQFNKLFSNPKETKNNSLPKADRKKLMQQTTKIEKELKQLQGELEAIDMFLIEPGAYLSENRSNLEKQLKKRALLTAKIAALKTEQV